jgi:iron complex outermembrane receptor protein
MTHGGDVETQSNSGLGVGIDLRGLGARSTVILLDGVGLAPSGNAAAFVDVSNIPVTAIDHIEILMDVPPLSTGRTPLGALGISSAAVRTDMASAVRMICSVIRASTGVEES